MTRIASMWKWFGGALTVVVVLFVWLGGEAEHLLLGWLYFPLRVVPQMTVDVPAALLGAAALLSLVLMLHVSAMWFVGARDEASGRAPGWSWRSTLASTMVLLLLFVAGTAMVGATHQFVWLLNRRGQQSPPKNDKPSGILDHLQASTRKLEYGSNLKMTGIGIQTYHDTWKSIPPGGTMNENGELLHGWAAYIGSQTGYSVEEVDYAVPWNQPPNDKLFKCNLWPFCEPWWPGPHFDEHGFGLSHIAGNVHVLPLRTVHLPTAKPAGIWDSLSSLRQDSHVRRFDPVGDGASNTLLIGTVVENYKPWGHPANLRDPARGINRHPDGFGGLPGWGGAQFVMCDGSVRFISDATDPGLLAQMATPSGGERQSMVRTPGDSQKSNLEAQPRPAHD